MDVSDVTEKGRSGRTYRLHFALDIFQMRSVKHKITTSKIGESICNFTLQPGHLAMADRGYTGKGIEHCEKSGAEYILCDFAKIALLFAVRMTDPFT